MSYRGASRRGEAGDYGPVSVVYVQVPEKRTCATALATCLVLMFFVTIGLVVAVVALVITGDNPLNESSGTPPPPPPPLPAQYNHSTGPLLQIDPFVYDLDLPSPASFAYAPSGGWVYVLDAEQQAVAVYLSDFFTGQLYPSYNLYVGYAPMQGVAATGGVVASTITMSASGTFLYLTYTGSTNVTILEIDSSGNLFYLDSQPMQGAPNFVLDSNATPYVFVCDQAEYINIMQVAPNLGILNYTAISRPSSAVYSLAVEETGTWLYGIGPSISGPPLSLFQWTIGNNSIALVTNTFVTNGATQLAIQGPSLYYLVRSSIGGVWVSALDSVTGAVATPQMVSPSTSPYTSVFSYALTDAFLYILFGTATDEFVAQYTLSTLVPLGVPYANATLAFGGSRQVLLTEAAAQEMVYLCTVGSASVLQYVIE